MPKTSAQLKWNSKHPEKINEWALAWYHRNADSVLDKKKAYYKYKKTPEYQFQTEWKAFRNINIFN